MAFSGMIQKMLCLSLMPVILKIPAVAGMSVYNTEIFGSIFDRSFEYLQTYEDLQINGVVTVYEEEYYHWNEDLFDYIWRRFCFQKHNITYLSLVKDEFLNNSLKKTLRGSIKSLLISIADETSNTIDEIGFHLPNKYFANNSWLIIQPPNHKNKQTND